MSRHSYWPQYNAHVYTDDTGPMSLTDWEIKQIKGMDNA